MTYRLEEPAFRRDVVVIPTVWLTIALSLLVHMAALWILIPRLDELLPLENQPQSNATDRLEVQLTPPRASPPAPVTAPPQIAQAQLAPRPRLPKPAPRRPAPPPPVLASPSTSAPTVASAPPDPLAPAVPAKTYPPIPGDLSSYIEAKRRERGEAPAADPAPTSAEAEAASENARISSAIAANLPSTQSAMDGRDRRRSGGIFEIKRIAYDDAAFEFFGWNGEMGRRTAQLIEVRKGTNEDMRIAVVRRMIVIIRQHEQGDFVWESKRLGRNLTLSARLADTAALEAFMLQEFFDNTRLR